jgi:CheY-like chemotaxis protein
MAKLLIVDDEKNIRARLATFFEGCGHRVLTAESGARALEELSREPVDLVLTDYRMAELNGLELLR